MIDPPLADLAKAVCCPDRSKRCTGECPYAMSKHFPSAVAVRDEYLLAQRPTNPVLTPNVTPK